MLISFRELKLSIWALKAGWSASLVLHMQKVGFPTRQLIYLIQDSSYRCSSHPLLWMSRFKNVMKFFAYIICPKDFPPSGTQTSTLCHKNETRTLDYLILRLELLYLFGNKKQRPWSSLVFAQLICAFWSFAWLCKIYDFIMRLLFKYIENLQVSNKSMVGFCCRTIFFIFTPYFYMLILIFWILVVYTYVTVITCYEVDSPHG